MCEYNTEFCCLCFVVPGLDSYAGYGTSNKVSNIITRRIENRKLLLICILLLSHSLIFFRFLFYQYMVVFLFNTVIYVFLL